MLRRRSAPRSAFQRSPDRPTRRFAGRWIAAFLLGIVLCGDLPGAAARSDREPAEALGVVGVAHLPPEGRTVLAAIRAGGPFASKRDGVVFGNREGLLPRRTRGYYAEYTVPTPGASTRGARRIVAGRGVTGDYRTSNEYYYTNDHYQSFRRIVQ